MGREIELKLLLPREAVARLRRHPVMAAGERLANATLDNTYYDTQALALKKRGIGLRTRKLKNTWLQTVKCAAPSVGGLSQRPEWEQPYGGAFDFAAIDDTRTREHLVRHQPNLIPVFSTRFKRDTRRYSPNEHVSILLMFDEGEIAFGTQREPLCELELELEHGTPLDLLKLASELAADLPLQPSNTSKAERGYRLHEGHTAQSRPIRAAKLNRHHPPAEAFRLLARDGVLQWQGCIERITPQTAPEAIHQLRVAQRRLRALMKAFGPALPETFVRTWNKRLGDNADRFSTARDLDVTYDNVVAPVTGTHADELAGLERLRAVIDEARRTAHLEVAHALEPAAQARLILEFMVELYSLPIPATCQPVDLRAFARRRTTQLRGVAIRRLKRAGDLSPDHIHRLRIAIKHLRYSGEFFASLEHKQAARRAAKSFTKAQQRLGDICDGDMASSRLTALAGDDSQLQFAAAFVRGWHGSQRDSRCRKALSKTAALLKSSAAGSRSR